MNRSRVACGTTQKLSQAEKHVQQISSAHVPLEQRWAKHFRYNLVLLNYLNITTDC